ncbi:MAG: glycosyltransferase, partial [Solirubrobacterales bacterium]|nr:glycosyltransferase [Solirubrobacterales bacterium]
GRGRALRQVWLDSEADILSYMDVDLSTDLDAFPPLIEALASGDYDLAIGTRLHPESMVRRCWKREMISRGYNRLLRLALHVRFSDAQCGFKALTRRAARQLLPLVEDNEWFFDTELLVMAERYGYRIYEQPVKWTEDPDSRVRLLPTIWGDLKGILRLCRALKRGIHEPLRVERTGLKARLSRCV